MDLGTIALNSATIEILHPATREPVGVQVTLRSRHSDEIKAVERKYQQKVLRSGRGELNVKDIEAQTLDILVAAVEDWVWSKDTKWDGKSPTVADVRTILADKRAAFIRDQIDRALADEALFTNASVTN